MTELVFFLVVLPAVLMAAVGRWLTAPDSWPQRCEDRKRAAMNDPDDPTMWRLPDYVADAQAQLADGLREAHVGPVPSDKATVMATAAELHAAGLTLDSIGPWPHGSPAVRLIVTVGRRP